MLGPFYDVANELGHGFSEDVLSRALVVGPEGACCCSDRRSDLQTLMRPSAICVISEISGPEEEIPQRAVSCCHANGVA